MAVARRARACRGDAVGAGQERTRERPGRSWDAPLKICSIGGAKRANVQPCLFASQKAPHLQYAEMPAR
eukprot:5448467-Pyramimonas_sp.AAC.1